MKPLVIALGMLFATSSFAGHSLFSDGGFRRAEALSVAGVKKSNTRVGVFGLSRGAKADSRILFVENHTGQVTVLNAPFDFSKPVTKVTASGQAARRRDPGPGREAGVDRRRPLR